MNTFKIFSLALALCFVSSIYGQKDETLFGSRSVGLTGFWAAGGLNYTSFENDWSFFGGTNFSFEFGKSLLIGWGNYTSGINIDIQGLDTPVSFKYGGLMLGFTPQSRKVLHPRITLLTGRGRATFTDDGDSDRVFVFQPSAGLELNVFRWFRVGAEGGYRIVSGVDSNLLTNKDLSRPFAQVDLRFGFSWGR